MSATLPPFPFFFSPFSSFSYLKPPSLGCAGYLFDAVFAQCLTPSTSPALLFSHNLRLWGKPSCFPVTPGWQQTLRAEKPQWIVQVEAANCSWSASRGGTGSAFKWQEYGVPYSKLGPCCGFPVCPGSSEQCEPL